MVAQLPLASLPRLEHARICSSLCLFMAACCTDLLAIGGGVKVGGRDPEWNMHSPADHKQIQSEEAAAQEAPGGTRPQVPE